MTTQGTTEMSAEERVVMLEARLGEVRDAVAAWHPERHDVASCRDFGCKDCVVVACAWDVRVALGLVGSRGGFVVG